MRNTKHLTYREHRFLHGHLNRVRHITLDPDGPGVVRIHLVPCHRPDRETPFTAILNGQDILPLNDSWAILLTNLIEALNPYTGKEIRPQDWEAIQAQAVSATRKIYRKAEYAQIEGDLQAMLDCLCTVARGGTPTLTIQPMQLAAYASRMVGPHRMDLMVSSMVKDGAWHCNQKCLHCYAANQPLSAVPELDTDQWLAVIEKCRSAGVTQLTFTGGEPGSEESKALRKGFMTVLAVYRDTVINSYYGDRAAVIQYPISNTSWAAPQPADEGYRAAYSVDADGNDIFDSSMNDEQKYDAALKAAVTFFEKAGYTFDADGKVASAPAGAPESYEILIPGQGKQDHPTYGIATAASKALETIGIKLTVNDVGTSVWNNALEGNTAQMWVAAWQSTADPDMYQVYHSSNAHGKGTNSNHYQVDDPALDALIIDGRTSADTEYRKSVYKQAMEIIMDWGVELPVYQRKDCTVASTIRVDCDTLPKDMTPYWGWKAEIETLAVK